MDPGRSEMTDVEVGPRRLKAFLGVPKQAGGIVIFAHGSGSGRLSPRNQHVAAALRRAGFATLLLDLLTVAEESDRARVFDIALLAQRLGDAISWTSAQLEIGKLPIGLFGASTGAGAALTAAARHDGRVRAIVSRGGRPDLAGAALEYVRAPTLLIVGGRDRPVIALNKEALARLRCEKRLIIVPGATHLFEEPGTLDEVIGHAADWFHTHLSRPLVRSAFHVAGS
jgi:putative phosphoribosyl transferase